jgi:hypothetical protein
MTDHGDTHTQPQPPAAWPLRQRDLVIRSLILCPDPAVKPAKAGAS